MLELSVQIILLYKNEWKELECSPRPLEAQSPTALTQHKSGTNRLYLHEATGAQLISQQRCFLANTPECSLSQSKRAPLGNEKKIDSELQVAFFSPSMKLPKC